MHTSLHFSVVCVSYDFTRRLSDVMLSVLGGRCLERLWRFSAHTSLFCCLPICTSFPFFLRVLEWSLVCSEHFCSVWTIAIHCCVWRMPHSFVWTNMINCCSEQHETLVFGLIVVIWGLKSSVVTVIVVTLVMLSVGFGCDSSSCKPQQQHCWVSGSALAVICVSFQGFTSPSCFSTCAKDCGENWANESGLLEPSHSHYTKQWLGFVNPVLAWQALHSATFCPEVVRDTLYVWPAAFLCVFAFCLSVA